jgi:hypothetical protein
MNQAVLDISATQLTLPSGLFRINVRREILLLGLVLIALQVADGVLTGMGMAHFGIHAEGNVLLKSLMQLIGYVPALVLAKGLAVIVVCTLCVLSNKIFWIPRAMKVVIGIYLFAAVIPWTMLLWDKVF